MSFKVGDKTVHRAHGVGEITSIEEKRIKGQVQSFYVIHIVESGMKVMVPVEGADGLLRPIISRQDAKRVVETLKRDEVAVTAQPWNRRYREYMEMLNSGSPVEVAKVLRLEQARNLLVAELALARRCKEQKVEKELDALLG